MNHARIALFTLLALVFIAGAAAAQRHMMGGPGYGQQQYGQQQYSQGYGQQQYGQGYGYEITEEQWNQMHDLQQKHRDEVMPLQQKLWSKDAELASLLHQDNPDEKKVDALIEEISDLRAAIYKKQLKFRRSAQKELGVPMGPGTKMGPGMGYGMGRGRMTGPGMMGSGWGSCPYTQGF